MNEFKLEENFFLKKKSKLNCQLIYVFSTTSDHMGVTWTSVMTHKSGGGGNMSSDLLPRLIRRGITTYSGFN